MTALDTAKAVLGKASLFDQTFATPDLGIAVAWAEALGDMDRADAVQAVTNHYSVETRRLMPADVIAGVRAIRNERIRVDMTDPPYERDDIRGGIAAIRAHRKALGDGRGRTEDMTNLPTRPVENFLRVAASRLPRMPKGDAS